MVRSAGNSPRQLTAKPVALCQEDVDFKGYVEGKTNSWPAILVQRAASLGSPYIWLNWTWGILFTSTFPALVSGVWFGVIKTGSPTGSFGDKAVWVFLVNPVTQAFLSYLFITLFFTALTQTRAWRPLTSYILILLTVFCTQVIYPGAYVLAVEPHSFMALSTIALTFIVTLIGMRCTPHEWFDTNTERYWRTYKTFVKVSIIFVLTLALLAGYMMANLETTGAVQGITTFALTIVLFIFKKVLLSMTDRICIETSMVMAGFWLENLADVFIVMAFPNALDAGITFAIIFFTRVLENSAYLAFQLDVWFTFRIWIKGKFKKNTTGAIEEDENPDDRGHGSSHPGYRRRQLRFLIWKLLSQFSSYIYFLIVTPALRKGPNKARFPFSESPPDFVLTDDQVPLTRDRFNMSLAFAAGSLASILVSGAVVWAFMKRNQPKTLQSLRDTYNEVVILVSHHSLVVTILVSNALIATCFLMSYYRVYYN